MVILRKSGQNLFCPGPGPGLKSILVSAVAKYLNTVTTGTDCHLFVRGILPDCRSGDFSVCIALLAGLLHFPFGGVRHKLILKRRRQVYADRAVRTFSQILHYVLLAFVLRKCSHRQTTEQCKYQGKA